MRNYRVTRDRKEEPDSHQKIAEKKHSDSPLILYRAPQTASGTHQPRRYQLSEQLGIHDDGIYILPA